MVEADKVDIDELLYQIITDRRYISAMDNTGKIVDFMVRSLTPSERTYAEFLYKKALNEGRRLNLLSKKQQLSDAIAKDLWTEDKEKLIKICEAEIKQLEKQRSMYANSLNKGKQIKFRNDVIKAKKRLEELEQERDSYTIHSLENYAQQIRANYVIGRLIINIDGTQRWPKYDDFLDEIDIALISSIIQNWNKNNFSISEKEIREIARSPSWSVMWHSSKTSGDNLFGRPSTEYTTEQSLLCYWAMTYDNVYQSLERPLDSVIEDDEALDRWFEQQKKERKKKISGNSDSDGDVFNKHKLKGNQEQFVMVNNDEEADEIWELNDEWTLARLQKEREYIENSPKAYIKEYELRKNFIKRNIQLNNSDKFASARKEMAKKPRFLG